MLARAPTANASPSDPVSAAPAGSRRLASHAPLAERRPAAADAGRNLDQKKLCSPDHS